MRLFLSKSQTFPLAGLSKSLADVLPKAAGAIPRAADGDDPSANLSLAPASLNPQPQPFPPPSPLPSRYAARASRSGAAPLPLQRRRCRAATRPALRAPVRLRFRCPRRPSLFLFSPPLPRASAPTSAPRASVAARPVAARLGRAGAPCGCTVAASRRSLRGAPARPA
jgi:hypothetical protein